MVSRRTVITTAAVVPIVGLAGCGNVINEEYDAEPAGLTQTTLQDYDYIEEAVTSQDVSRDFAGQTVTVTSWASIYRGSTTDQTDLAPVFGVLSTPQVRIAGTEQNPADGWSPREIITELEGEVDFGGELENLDETGEQSVQILGESRTITTFSATVQRSDTTVDMTLHVSNTFTDGDDILAVAGAYPQIMDEQQTIIALMEAVEHPIETNA